MGNEENWDKRRSQLDKRIKDILALVKQFKTQPYFLQNVLNFPPRIKLDLDKLVISGHSFGGLTALLTAAQNRQFKACLTMDPWFIQ